MLNNKALSAAAAVEPAYIEEVFSVTPYTGTGSTREVVNNIDTVGEGGLVWIKRRDSNGSHMLWDTVRGVEKRISSDGTASQVTDATGLSLFTSNSFWVGSSTSVNANGGTYISWTFRKAKKFFDVVTYTGNGSGSGQVISHNLGSAPGCIIAKATSTTSAWAVYHKDASLLSLNATNAAGYVGAAGNPPTSTTFNTEIVKSATGVEANANGVTYVAYLFAHDAGGFGDSGSENVISCGSFTGSNVNNVTVNLGYEPQYILWKNATSADSWYVADGTRGMPIGSGTSSNTQILLPNSGSLEATQNGVAPTATGFTWYANGAVAASDTYIYIAIRRGLMKKPEIGTQVYNQVVRNPSPTATITTNFPVDLIVAAQRSKAIVSATVVFDRLRGTSLTAGTGLWLTTNTNQTEQGDYGQGIDRSNTGYVDNFFYVAQSVTSPTVYWNFRRAPGFLDIVCYTGNGTNRTINHNLGAIPELIIVKDRTAGFNGKVYSAALGNTKYLELFGSVGSAAPVTSSVVWNNTSPTSTVFTIGTMNDVNFSGTPYIAYLFGSVPGVSKVGSYTGTGTTNQINCGFTAGARFVLIKRTDTTGSWYVWDTGRGIAAGNDPYLLLDSAAGEVTSTDYIDPYSPGFEISSTAPAAINANGGTYIYLAIA